MKQILNIKKRNQIKKIIAIILYFSIFFYMTIFISYGLGKQAGLKNSKVIYIEKSSLPQKTYALK